MLSSFTHTGASAYIPKVTTWGSCACAHHREPSRRISVVKYFLPTAIAPLSVVTYSVPNHNSGICGVCKRAPQLFFNPTRILNHVFSHCTKLFVDASLVRYVLSGAIFVQNMEARKHGLCAMVKARSTWQNGHHRCKRRIGIVLFFSSPFSRNPIHCNHNCILPPGLARTIGLICSAENIIKSFECHSQRQASFCLRLEGLRNQVVCLCACHAFLTTKICWLFFLSKTNGASDIRRK